MNDEPNLDFERSVSGRLRPVVVFFHIPKCAGTSIAAYLHRHYPEVLSGMDPGNILELMVGRRARGFAVAAHFDMDHYRRITLPHVSFTVIRHPHQRLASRYYSLAETTEKLGWPLLEAARDRSFLEWMRLLANRPASLAMNGPNGTPDQYYFGEMVRYLLGQNDFNRLRLNLISESEAVALAWHNLDAFDFILLTEQLHRGRLILDAIVGATANHAIGDYNVSRRTEQAGDQYTLSDDELQVANVLCRLELPLYRLAEQRFAEYGLSPPRVIQQETITFPKRANPKRKRAAVKRADSGLPPAPRG